MSLVPVKKINQVRKALPELLKGTFSSDMTSMITRMNNVHGVAVLDVSTGSTDGVFKITCVAQTAKAVESLQVIFTRWMKYMGDYSELNTIPQTRIHHLSKLTLEKVVDPFDKDGLSTLWAWTISTDASENKAQLPWRLSALESSTRYLESK